MNFVRLFMVLVSSCVFSAASAKNLEVDLMICKITNLFNVKIGQIHAVGPMMGLKMGLLRSPLNVESIEENKITTADQGQNFVYTLVFDQIVAPETDVYTGSVYSQYAKGFGSLPVWIGNLKCTISVK